METSLGNMAKPCLYKKLEKVSWVWWYTPVVPATLKAVVGGWLESRRQRLQRAKIMPLHSSLSDRGRTCLKKKRKRKMYITQWNIRVSQKRASNVKQG